MVKIEKYTKDEMKMKALKGKVIKTIISDEQGRRDLRKFIGSGKKKGEIKMSNGDTYIVVPSFSPEYESLAKQTKK